MEIFFTPKNAEFVCNLCDFKCYKNADWKRHTETKKHMYRHNGNFISKNADKNAEKNAVNTCDCGRSYASNSGLWKHKKICQSVTLKNTIQTTDIHAFVNFLIKENSDLKTLLLDQNNKMENVTMELAKNSGNNNTTTNSHNQSFNINMYLNETCKNAMNIMEFVEQLKIDNKDLEETGRLGYAEGISRIFINGLNNLNVNDRPIHCSDGKRETIYIKDNNVWNKETTDKNILTNAVKCLGQKNIKQIFEWTKCNPEYKNSSSKVNDRYLKIVSESMSGSTIEETNKNYEKIIKNVANATIIDKMNTIC